MTMRRLTIIMILLAIVAFCTASYYLLQAFGNPEKNASNYPAPSFIPISPTNSPSIPPTEDQKITLCTPETLKAAINSQGAAGNIYATITITNIGKTACDVVLGNTITGHYEASNIVQHQYQIATPEYFKLDPSQSVYSQVHYPNGPQCQNGITQKPITLLYAVPQTSSTFDLTAASGKLTIQACTSPTEKTTVDIWPLSQSPITP